MVHKKKLRCPNCVRNLPRGLTHLNEGLPCLRVVAHMLSAGPQVSRCPYCCFVWKQSVGTVTRIEVTALGFYRSDTDRPQRLPTGFKPASLEPEQGRPLPPLPGMKSYESRGRPKKRDQPRAGSAQVDAACLPPRLLKSKCRPVHCHEMTKGRRVIRSGDG